MGAAKKQNLLQTKIDKISNRIAENEKAIEGLQSECDVKKARLKGLSRARTSLIEDLAVSMVDDNLSSDDIQTRVMAAKNDTSEVDTLTHAISDLDVAGGKLVDLTNKLKRERASIQRDLDNTWKDAELRSAMASYGGMVQAYQDLTSHYDKMRERLLTLHAQTNDSKWIKPALEGIGGPIAPAFEYLAGSSELATTPSVIDLIIRMATKYQIDNNPFYQERTLVDSRNSEFKNSHQFKGFGRDNQPQPTL